MNKKNSNIDNSTDNIENTSEHVENDNIEAEDDIEVNTDIFTNIKQVTTKDKNLDGVILPSGSFSIITDFIKTITEDSKDKKDNYYTDEENLAIGVNFSSKFGVVKNGVFKEQLSNIDNNWTNIIRYAEKELAIREIPHKTNAGNKKIYRSSDSVSRFLSYLGKGGVTQIPLWHSGFWVTLKPITDSDLINLELQLANEQIALGRKTNGMIYSNYNVVFVRILTDFILNHVENTTVKLDNDEDIRDYIKIQDLYPLVLGVISLLYPTGFNNFRTCKNSLKTNEDKKPKCTYVVQAKLDPKKMLWVNKKVFDTYHKNIMVKRVPNTVSKEEVIEYQDTLSVNKKQKYSITLNNGKTVELIYKTPTIMEHIKAGEQWINSVVELVEESLTEDVNINEKNRRIAIMSKSSILSIYIHYVDSITIDGQIFKDDAIHGILEVIANIQGYKEIKEDIEHYISNSVCSIVAIPNYICPNCNESQEPDDVNSEVFKEFIPLGVLSNFFDLSTLRTTTIAERETNDI